MVFRSGVNKDNRLKLLYYCSRGHKSLELDILYYDPICDVWPCVWDCNKYLNLACFLGNSRGIIISHISPPQAV